VKWCLVFWKPCSTLASATSSYISVTATAYLCDVLSCAVQVLACVIDVGTDNAALRRDSLYCGLNMPRLTGKAYYDVVDEVSTSGDTSATEWRHWDQCHQCHQWGQWDQPWTVAGEMPVRLALCGWRIHCGAVALVLGHNISW
jgi:hypothetical protein